jgi:hypothetical protein
VPVYSINIFMQEYCARLNLDIPLLSPRVDINKFKQRYHTKGHISDINPTLLNFLYKKRLSVPLVEAFYSEPNYTMKIHIDTVPGDFTKLNWAFGGQDSLMHWYRVKENIPVIQKTNMIGKGYSEYTADQVELCHSEAIGTPSIVQVGVPHNITNPFEDRLCICLVILKDGVKLTMQETLDIFKSETEF